MSAILFGLINGSLLLGLIPDSLSLLIFGVTLIFFSVGLRKILSRNNERHAAEKFEQKPEKTN